MSADAHHITAPTVDGPKRSMLSALNHAGINKNEIGYVNAHGTSTPLGDINETNAIKETFNDHAKKIGCKLNKINDWAFIGWRRRIESVFTALAIHHQISPTK